MPKAEWNGAVIAETDTYETVEGNIYFPPSSIKKEFFTKTTHTTNCPWKGNASYYSLVVNGETNENAAWVYEAPLEKASNIKDHFAFWKGVSVTK
ncbi:MAG: DUF427 domain-containing protein [Pseudomonadota bacterium]